MQDWMLPRITDYWDQQVEAIERLSRRLEGVPDGQMNARMEPISAAVKRHADMLSDEELRQAAMIMAEDLYKACAQTSRIDLALQAYLYASGRALLDVVAARGYMLHYFIGNTWDRLDGPVIGFPRLFRAAGIIYLCPQEMAVRHFEKDKPAEQWPALVTKYIAKARTAADDFAEECHNDGQHFVYLDIDATEFPAALKHIGEPGVIHVFRGEAPTPGSCCVVNMPSSPRKRQETVSRPPGRSSVTIRDADGREVAANIDDLEFLLPNLQSKDSDSREFSRSILKDQITRFLSTITPDTDLTAVKALLVKFQDAGWQLCKSNVPEGFYTVTASIDAVADAIAVNQTAQAVLQAVLDERVMSMTESPAAQGTNLIPEFSALLKAIKRAQGALH